VPPWRAIDGDHLRGVYRAVGRRAIARPYLVAMDAKDFDCDILRGVIAQEAMEARDSSRLLVADTLGGMLRRTPRVRIATERAYLHLGVEFVAGQDQGRLI